MTQDEMDYSVYSRLTQVETDVAGLKTDVSYIRQAIDGLKSSAQPQWQNYFAWAALILTIIGAFGQGYIRDVSDNTDAIKEMIVTEARHEERIKALSRESQLMAEHDRREMILREQALTSRIIVVEEIVEKMTESQ